MGLLALGLVACGEVHEAPAAVDDVALRDFIHAQGAELAQAMPAGAFCDGHQNCGAPTALGGAAAQALRAAPPSVVRPGPQPRLPIVLVHGMAGFRPIARMLDYFYRVRRAIAADGYVVYASQTDPFQGVAYRGRQLAVQVDEVLRLTGAPRVHLIAHSQGGLDARYMVASMGYGDRVASLITVSTPHHGVPLVDVALRMKPAWVARVAHVVDALANALLGGHASLVDQLHDLSQTTAAEQFNPSNLDDPRVEYYSYGGRTQASPFVNRRFVDIVNPLLLGTHRLLSRASGDNDGLVPVSSATWGTYMGAFPADHWDEIGQPPLALHWAFDHVGFYRALARFLEDAAPPPLY